VQEKNWRDWELGLARLGRRVQTLAVTHAPQVAAGAEHHYLIAKNVLHKGERVATHVSEFATANLALKSPKRRVPRPSARCARTGG
jgi:hypothetical protein